MLDKKTKVENLTSLIPLILFSHNLKIVSFKCVREYVSHKIFLKIDIAQKFFTKFWIFLHIWWYLERIRAMSVNEGKCRIPGHNLAGLTTGDRIQARDRIQGCWPQRLKDTGFPGYRIQAPQVTDYCTQYRDTCLTGDRLLYIHGCWPHRWQVTGYRTCKWQDTGVKENAGYRPCKWEDTGVKGNRIQAL